MDVVTEILNKAANDEAEKLKSVQVDKHLELEYDLGSLLALDTNDLDLTALRSNTDEYLKNLARDNTQLLLNQIWELPSERMDDAIVVRLPPASTILPRENRIPKPKPLTKWQRFAREKGIQRKKKGKLTWDDALKKWVPNYGYRKAKAEKEKNWLVEVPQSSDPMQDQFAARAEKRKERIAKNEFQRLRNLASAKKIKVPRVGIPPAERLSSEQWQLARPTLKRRFQANDSLLQKCGLDQPYLASAAAAGCRKACDVFLPWGGRHWSAVVGNTASFIFGSAWPCPVVGDLLALSMPGGGGGALGKALTIARVSTASLGKFQDKLPKEKMAKNIGTMLPTEKKKKQPYTNPEQERKANLGILDGILNKRPQLDIEKAVNREIYKEQQERSEEKRNQKPKKGKRRGGIKKGKGAGKRPGTKPSGGKGLRRKPGQQTGRKRR
ncbi:hypothetical protein PR048_022903 [Dryococelus australis]|uniref:Ribosome biogenesis regulatory protein n=1 Tax=Dryococelus australis TaxID=614101 RepID=A0ABQ9GSN2_9NEOP|nr:hypothetical protein PR048_022903 [Dryococelus australis]